MSSERDEGFVGIGMEWGREMFGKEEILRI